MQLNPDIACALTLKLSRYHGKELAGPDVVASNGVDDGMDETLLSQKDEGVRADIEGLVAGMNVDEARDLSALILWGRDAGAYGGLDDARKAAKDAGAPIKDVLFGDPLSASHLRAGLEKAGVACDGMDGSERL